jgi:hypothetical protein
MVGRWWIKERRNMATKVIRITDEKNDDWMKSLPGYKNEVKMHEDLAKKYAAQQSVDNKKPPDNKPK